MNILEASCLPKYYFTFLLLMSTFYSVEEARAQIYASRRTVAKLMLGAGLIGGLALFAKGYHLGSIGNEKYANDYSTYIPVKGYDGSTRIIHHATHGYHPPYIPIHHHGYNAQHLVKPILHTSTYGPYHEPFKVVLPPQRVIHKNPRGTIFVTNHIHNYHRGLYRHKRSLLHDSLLLEKLMA